MRWIAGARLSAEPAGDSEANRAWAALRELPALLSASGLPNGIVELVVEDPYAPRRQLLDIHEGKIEAIEPGSAVPWASIAGPPSAWLSALGPRHRADALHTTGDRPLAQRVLDALPGGLSG